VDCGKDEEQGEGGKDQASQMQVYRQQSQGEGRKGKQQQWWERQPQALMHPSILELCFHRHNPKVQAQTYLEVFHQMLGEGLIDRYKGLYVL
jgi:hypothetical protein